MPFSAGFDSKYYPGIDTMNYLSANSNLAWCGYYLAPAPNRGPTGWPGQYAALQPNWGVVPIYVGQQDPHTATPRYIPSSILTAAQGALDAADASNLATNDGFPPGTYIYLDWEYGGLDANGTAYIQSWVQTLIGGGTFNPGIYCSHILSATMPAAVVAVDANSITRFWCWKIPPPTPFDGNLAAIPAIDPAGCGFAGAIAWQREVDAKINFPPGSGLPSITVDFDTSSLQNPASP
jgi:hypothetical protein